MLHEVLTDKTIQIIQTIIIMRNLKCSPEEILTEKIQFCLQVINYKTDSASV